MQLTARIKQATDGQLSLVVEELPALAVHASNLEDIPGAVRRAAAELTGRNQDDFEVDLRL